MAEVGPDGNVWVIDWYNYIVQHNPTPQGFKTGKGAAYETDLRDKKHARIYRIVYDGAKPATRFTLANATPEKLVETLKHDNMFWRKQAQRLLVERGLHDVVPGLIAAVADQSVESIGLNAGVIHALWTLHGLGVLGDSNPEAIAAAVGALRHPSPGVRRNAVQVLPRLSQSAEAILAARLTQDRDAQVRLAALLALADQPASPATAKAIAAALNDPLNSADRWIPDAAICAAAKNAGAFLTVASRCEAPSTKLLNAASIVADHFARGGPVDSIADVIAQLSGADASFANAVMSRREKAS
jgi:hypothetical protein